MSRCLLLCCLAATAHQTFALSMLDRISKDFAALRMRSTARHLMRPLTAEGRLECVELKSRLREEVDSGVFIVDAFALASQSNSTDPETSVQGGLLGERLQQGTVRAPELDRACFTAPLGQITGPIETSYGWHLVLVEERIGCRFDGGMTRVVPVDDGRSKGSVLRPAAPAEAGEVAQQAFPLPGPPSPPPHPRYPQSILPLYPPTLLPTLSSHSTPQLYPPALPPHSTLPPGASTLGKCARPECNCWSDWAAGCEPCDVSSS